MDTRLGWAISLLIHLCALGATFVTWPREEPDDSRGVVVTPVEIVNIADVADVLAEVPEVVEEPAAAPEISEPEPEPTPAPTPTAAPERRESRLDLRSLTEDLLENRERRPEGANIENARRGENTRRGVGLSRQEQATIESRVAGLMQAHMRRCWRAPADATDPRRLVVELQINLDAQGRLDGRPRVLRPTSVAGDPEMRVAVDRAIRAAFQCNPYPFPEDSVVGEHYEFWRENTYVFRVEE